MSHLQATYKAIYYFTYKALFLSDLRLVEVRDGYYFSCAGIDSMNFWAGYSKLTMSLVNISLKFQMFISQIWEYFLLKKFVKLLLCKSFSQFFQ